MGGSGSMSILELAFPSTGRGNARHGPDRTVFGGDHGCRSGPSLGPGLAVFSEGWTGRTTVDCGPRVTAIYIVPFIIISHDTE